jgi:hypothetical protein
MNSQIVFQSLITLVATIVGIFQITNRLPKSRNKLKQDLEILNILDPKDPCYNLVKSKIDADIDSIYAERKGTRHDERKSIILWYTLNYQKIDLIFGISSFLSGSIWSLTIISQKEISYWIIVSLVLLLGGLGELLVSIGDRERKYWPELLCSRDSKIY